MKILKYNSPFLILLSGLISWTCSIDERSSRETNANASEIISKLELYKNEHSTYPDSLQQLIPDYLERLPTVTILFGNRPFYYERFSNLDGQSDFFELYYFAPLGVEKRYNSTKKYWTTDD